MEQTPVSLLERLRQSHDHGAWERFVALYTPLLNHFVRRLGLQGPDLEDLVQDVFVVLVRHMRGFRYDSGQSFRGWLWTVTLNKFRERQRRRAGAAPAAAAALDGLLGHDDQTLYEQAEYQHYLVGRALQIMQAEFPAATWKACWQLVVEGRPAVKVAAALGLRPATVYAAKFRVLKHLRRELSGLLD